MNRPPDKRNLFTERGCCKRQSNFAYIGQDISGSPVSVDVGICRSHCGVPQRFNSYNSGFPGLPKHSSMLDFLKNKKLRERMPDTTLTSSSEPSCPHETSCQPIKVGLERILLFQGIKEVEVIEDCQCNPTPQECMRMPFLKSFFPETPFESTVDVGKCSSPTVSSGLRCAPIKFDTVIVESPNGAVVAQTVETCEINEICYRVTYFEYYYEVIYNTKGIKEDRLKEIDVGRCLGGCSSGNHCLLRDSRNRDHCLVWAEGSGSGCLPQEYETHTFRSRNGHIRSVLAIKTCKFQMSFTTFSYNTDEVNSILSKVTIPNTFLSVPSEEVRSRDYEKELRRHTALELHCATLAEYHRVQRIPRGLRVSLKPTLFADKPDYCTKFESIINKCSMDIIILTIEFLQKEIEDLGQNISSIEQQLQNTVPSTEWDRIHSKTKENIAEFRRTLQERKRSKFIRDQEDYSKNRVYRWQFTEDNPRRPAFYNRYSSSSGSDTEQYTSRQSRFLVQRTNQRGKRGAALSST
ncbi:uncharacterized protein ACNLHF_008074 [Anomaloglossus baeobatrachus]